MSTTATDEQNVDKPELNELNAALEKRSYQNRTAIKP